MTHPCFQVPSHTAPMGIILGPTLHENAVFVSSPSHSTAASCAKTIGPPQMPGAIPGTQQCTEGSGYFRLPTRCPPAYYVVLYLTFVWVSGRSRKAHDALATRRRFSLLCPSCSLLLNPSPISRIYFLHDIVRVCDQRTDVLGILVFR